MLDSTSTTNNSNSHLTLIRNKLQIIRKTERSLLSHMAHEYLMPTPIVNQIFNSSEHQARSLTLWDFLSPRLRIISSPVLISIKQEGQAFTILCAFTGLNTFHTQTVPLHLHRLAYGGIFLILTRKISTSMYWASFPSPHPLLFSHSRRAHRFSHGLPLWLPHQFIQKHGGRVMDGGGGGGGGVCCVRGLGEINCRHSSICRKANWEEGKGSPQPKPHLANNKRMPRWRCILILHHKPYYTQKNRAGNEPIYKARRNNQFYVAITARSGIKTNTNKRIDNFK